MRDLYWLSDAQLKLIQPYFPPSRGVQRVDDLRVVSGIIFVNQARSSMVRCVCLANTDPAQNSVQPFYMLKPEGV